MILDARSVPNDQILDTEVCIIGAGAAGITLARMFRNSPFRVTLLESGGFEADSDTQSLYQGSSIGHEYYPLDSSRLRFFGGTTNHWGGMCLPFDPIDFENRDWVPNSGWPIRMHQLESYYREAQKVCELGPYDYDESYWTQQRGKKPLPIHDGPIQPRIAQFSPPTRFGQTYREDILQSKSVTTYLYANVLEIEADKDARTVKRVKVATLEGNHFSVSAKYFILATGAIENARLLLLSRNAMAAGLGNQNGLVGRYFMERVNRRSGVLIPVASAAIEPFFNQDRLGAIGINGFLGIAADWQRRNRVLNSSIHLHARSVDSVGLYSLKHIRDSTRNNEIPNDLGGHVWEVIKDLDDIAGSAWDRWQDSDETNTENREESTTTLFEIWHDVEAVPNPASRVKLSQDLDRLGQHRITLDWQLTPSIEGTTIRKVLELFAAEAGRLGLGRVRTEIADKGDDWVPAVVGSFHQMGTTRINRDEKQGVVDENCKVHNISNLYIAGSSVFPTAGQANPTLTIVALSLRLGDRIKELLL